MKAEGYLKSVYTDVEGHDYVSLEQALRAVEIAKEETKLQLTNEAELYGWVARNKDGSLYLFEKEPIRSSNHSEWWDRDYHSTSLDENKYPDLRWEDEPIFVKLIIIKED